MGSNSLHLRIQLMLRANTDKQVLIAVLGAVLIFSVSNYAMNILLWTPLHHIIASHLWCLFLVQLKLQDPYVHSLHTHTYVIDMQNQWMRTLARTVIFLASWSNGVLHSYTFRLCDLALIAVLLYWRMAALSKVFEPSNANPSRCMRTYEIHSC